MHPLARPVGGLLLLLLLAPSAAYLWQNRDVPQFCDFHDDCVYFVSAKSLASGNGYRIESLPGQPAQTKYTPLYPLLLALAWRLDPEFPRNLTTAAWLSWLAFPPALILLARYTPYMGLRGWRAWLLLVLVALNPYVIWFASQLLSELLFLALMFAAMILVERSRHRPQPVLALAAGAMAGLAYLSRSAGIALLPGAFLYLWLRGRRRQAWCFAGAMLPFIAAWTGWARLHMASTTDLALIYYIDYAIYQRINVGLNDLHLYLWKNADGLLLGLGSLVLPKVTSSLALKILAEVIAVAMISGVVRLVKRGHARLYALFSLANAALLLIWHFPPDERFVLPMFPLALAGLITELEHFAGLLRASLRHRDLAQRVVAGAMIGVAGLVFGGALALQVYVAAALQPESARDARARNRDQLAAFAWIRENVPPQARFLAYADPRFYLYTGHPVIRQPLLPRLWYHQDHAGTIALWGDLLPFARAHGLTYYYFQPEDLSAATAEERAAILKAHRECAAMKPVFENRAARIYQFAD